MIYNVVLIRKLNKTREDRILVYTTNIEEKFNQFIYEFTSAYENVGVEIRTSYNRGKLIETLFVEII